MRLRKFHIIVCLLMSLTSCSLMGQSNKLQAEFDSIYQSVLVQIQSDKYYESLKNTESFKRKALENNMIKQVARAENLFYLAYQNMYAHEKSEKHLLEAIRLNSIAKDTHLLTQNYSNLAFHYIQMENFPKYDVSLRKSRELDKTNNHKSKFYHYESEVMALYIQKKYDSLVLISTKAREEIEKTETNEVASSGYIDKKWRETIKERLQVTFEYYLAYGLVETEQDLELANRLLNKVKDKKLEEILWFSPLVFKQYYRINKYKTEYFIKQKVPNFDSIRYYQNKAAFYFNKTTDFLEEKSGENINYLNLAIAHEMEIQQLDLLNTNKEQESNYITRFSYLMASLGLLSVLFIFYYRRANNEIVKINDTLDEKNTILKQLHIHRNKFLAVISHEIRTPMYALQELISNVTDDYENDKNEEFSLANYSLINLRNSVDNSLQFSRLNFYRDSLTIIDAPIDIKNMVSEIKRYYTPVLIINKVHLIIKIELQHNVFEFNRNKIAMVLHNILKNAIEFNDVMHVTFKVEETPISDNKSKIKFSVTDDGPGIKEEVLVYVNKGKINITEENVNKGIKLGLVLCNQILELYNSKLVFETAELENRVSFELELKRSTKLLNSSTNTVKSVGRKKILYVDDNKINLLITKKIIESLDHTCYTETSGKRAIERVQVFDYDLILMDINMPNMDGFETSKAIYEINNTIPIVAYTALSEDEIFYKCKASKISEVITKPLDSHQFKYTLDKYFGH